MVLVRVCKIVPDVDLELQKSLESGAYAFCFYIYLGCLY